MFVRSRSITSTAACLSRGRMFDKSSLIAEKNGLTLTCVTGTMTLTRETTGPHRTGVRWDDVPHFQKLRKVRGGGSLKHQTWQITCIPVFTLALDEQRF